MNGSRQLVFRNQAGRVSPHVVFGAGFRTGLDVLHGMLHIVTGRRDTGLANAWHLAPEPFDGDRPDDRARASQAITRRLDPGGWDCGANLGGEAP
ncbi:MAG: hypothetical protein Kow00109_29400 [Acidobacteriota bacterium]